MKEVGLKNQANLFHNQRMIPKTLKTQISSVLAKSSSRCNVEAMLVLFKFYIATFFVAELFQHASQDVGQLLVARCIPFGGLTVEMNISDVKRRGILMG